VRNSIRELRRAGYLPGKRIIINERFPGKIKKLMPGYLLRVVGERKDGSKFKQTISAFACRLV
jgi:hypothetical protein